MKCIVIDDEKPAVDLICSYIEKVPFLELAGSFTGVGKAITSVMSCPVDLIFSDIELNADINGIQLMKSLPDPPMVIFVSAFGRYESSTDAPNWNVIFFQYLRTSYLPGVQLSPKTRLFLSL